MHRRIPVLALAASCVLGPIACSDDDAEQPDPISTRNHLLWKRYHAVEQDLSRAMALDPTELCNELGEFNCVNRVHLTSLGGHDPFDQGLYAPLETPLVTTPIALERVSTSACGARVRMDAEGSAQVFTELDLAGDAPAADSDAYTDTVTDLYRRLLARDPVDAELDALQTLLVDEEGGAVPATEFAVTACVAIATTTEFLFY